MPSQLSLLLQWRSIAARICRAASKLPTLGGAFLTVAVAVAQIASAASRVDIAPVTFSATLMTRLHDSLGNDEIPALQQLVTDAVHKQMASDACGNAISIQIQLEDATPTHPTRSQMLNDPSLDFLHSRSVGGAELTGRLIGADGRPVATVTYRRYAQDIHTISMAADSWADARITVDQFAAKLMGECRAQQAARG